MKVYFAFFLIIGVALVGYHLTFRRLSPRGTGFRFVLTGLEFLVIGLLLGPRFSNVIDERTFVSLAPMSALLLGWIGLMAGFQFEWRTLRRFPPAFFFAGMIESAITALLVFSAVYLVLPVIGGVSPSMRLVAAAIMASVAACSAQAGLVLREGAVSEAKAGFMRFLMFMAGVNGLIPMIMLGMIYFFRPSVPVSVPWRNEILFLASMIVLLLLWIVWMSQRREMKDLALVVIGMTVLTSGAASMLGFSPLVANFFIGVFLVNFTREKEKIFHLLVSIEKPVYLVLLIFMGAAWHLDMTVVPFAALAFLILRIAAKTAGGYSAIILLPILRTYPRSAGLGLLEQGGLTLAILYDFQQRFAGHAVETIVGSVLLAVVIGNLISPHMLSRIFARHQNADPQ